MIKYTNWAIAYDRKNYDGIEGLVVILAEIIKNGTTYYYTGKEQNDVAEYRTTNLISQFKNTPCIIEHPYQLYKFEDGNLIFDRKEI